MLDIHQNVPIFAGSATVGYEHENHYLRCSMLVLDLNAGDQVDVTDIEGDQRCGLLVFDTQSKNSVPELILTDCQSENIDVTTLSQEDFFPDLNDYLNCNRKKLDNKCLTIINLTSAGGRPNCSALFEAKQSVVGILLAFGSSMHVDSQDSPTDLRVRVRRSFEKSTDTPSPLPQPLAETLEEIRVNKASALSYTVKKGQYIQIIDVEGHQCSDFQAFARHDLDKGETLGIEPTVTRTFAGLSYPAPGVHDKYYNVNSIPLVEIIRDTVGRHDTFGLACNSKYYEDLGHLGHANCTDNFNQTLAQYGIKPRLNWVTVNLFFNTNVEECHTISSDVSWSRPGDYVLFRALTDLVCVSSACPDDVSPANDWNPTDVHIRIYDSTHDFSQALTLRPTPQSKPIMTTETGFHPSTSKLTRDFIDYKGYWLASSYTNYGPIKEYWACREDVIAIDLSPLRKFEIYGQDSEELMQYALTRNIRKLAIGQVVYSAICYENGGMIDDGTLFRLGENNFRWICGSDYCGIWLRKLAEKMNLQQVWVKSSTDQMHNISVQGPKSRDLMRKIVWTAKAKPTVDELGWFRFTSARLYEETGLPVIISRTGYTGELGYEIFCHPKNAPTVWEEVFKAGKEFNIAPLGLDALDMVRIEAGLVFADYEFCDQTDPFEAGIGFTVPLISKEDDFCGKEALIRRKEKPTQKLVGLELSGNEIALHGDGVFIDMQQVGVITSATRSPILKKNIALCRMSVQTAELGVEVEVGKLDNHQKRLAAKVCAFPFYDPEKLRVRS